MRVLITGAQFHNKGAQALLFSVMDSLQSKYSDVEIYYMPLDDVRDYPSNTYKFNLVYGRWDAHMYENEPVKRPYVIAVALVRRLIRKKTVSFSDITKLHTILPTLDAVIDVSGFQLTSKFENKYSNQFLDYIDEAKRYNKPVILMPQSFGPFEYKTDREKMLARITTTLAKADIIFAREKEGYELLKNIFHLNNVKMSTDLVLQTEDPNISNIFTKLPKLNYQKLSTANNVGIIPNNETIRHGDETKILALYQNIISHLLDRGKHVYIFRHSDDLEICKKIYNIIKNNDRVVLLEDDMNCLEYSRFIKQFEFIIASRFHAIVHAYKVHVPAIILGWAVKYNELATLFGQERYVFDISESNCETDGDKIINAIDEMNTNKSEEVGRLVVESKRLMHQTCLKDCWDILDLHR